MAMRQIIINVPDDVLASEHLDEAAFAREISLLAAIKLFELGRLSSGRAAELAGMPRVQFLDELKKYHVFPLESELAELESDRG
jgi:predicted HTH domain antitoxin